jgi:ABC-type dipeptide/oligopeptide/nickel transport system permease subunit
MSLTEVQTVGASVEQAPARAIEGRSPWQLAWRRLRSDKVAVACAIIIVLLCALALAAPLIASATGKTFDEQFRNTGITAQGLPVAPGGQFWFGTDNLGRDIFIRVIYGARISLLVGLSSTAIAVVAGVIVGLFAGYYGGAIDAVLARFTDTVLAFPYLLLAIALAALFGPNLLMVIGVISFFSWAALARIVRGQTLALKEKEYVEAARAIGSSPLRIMFIDILPNVMAPVIVIATLLVPSAIVFEATLSFLGVGVVPPTPSWGNMISDSLGWYTTSWWFLIFPSVALLLTTLAFNLLGDGIRDALDPQTERIFAGRRRGSKPLPIEGPTLVEPAKPVTEGE